MRAFQSLLFFSFVFQVAGCPMLRAGDAFRRIVRGRWSLHMCWLVVMLDEFARLDEARVRSIVVGLPVDGLIRVPRLCGVRRHMGSPLLESRSQSGGFSIQMPQKNLLL